MDIQLAAALLAKFAQPNLTQKIAALEKDFKNIRSADCAVVMKMAGGSMEVLTAAQSIKRTVGQINTVIHALGILCSLAHLLERDEMIESLSLGAGNTGKAFDLETNRRIAEFKFIDWRGGSETIRQNSLFKDFYLLAEYDTLKKKQLCVLNSEIPLKFLHSGRAIASVLEKNPQLLLDFRKKYPNFAKVKDYFEFRNNAVSIEDISSWIPELLREDKIKCDQRVDHH